MKYNESILATIVLYKTSLYDSKTFLSLTQSLKAQNICLDLVVYDNSPEFNQDSIFQHPNWRITYIADINNSGVSKAYNTAAEIAGELGKRWIIFFDQDTTFPENTIDSYIKTINNYPDYKLFAPIMLSNQTIISPCRFKFMRGTSFKSVDAGVNKLQNKSVINCGMCVDTDAFEKNNGYNELLKLDFSDHDFVRRFKKNVTNEFVVIDLKVQHELSTKSKNSLDSDLIRFDHYLAGGGIMSTHIVEVLFIRINAMIRALKLTSVHHTHYFLLRLFKLNIKKKWKR